MKIQIDTTIDAQLSEVWHAWTSPEHIKNWNFASHDWACSKAEINLVEGGQFNYRMEAKDGSMGFDFSGTFTKVEPNKSIYFDLEDGRDVIVNFLETSNGIQVTETFEADDVYSAEQQKAGWQSILNNFRGYVERKGS